MKFHYVVTNLTNDAEVARTQDPAEVHKAVLDLLESGLEVSDIGIFLEEV